MCGHDFEYPMSTYTDLRGSAIDTGTGVLSSFKVRLALCLSGRQISKDKDHPDNRKVTINAAKKFV